MRIQRFEIADELGRGAMGIVYRARDPQLDREVAIKVLGGAAAPAPDELVSRRTIDLRVDVPADDLLSEARIMARLAHPNVVPVYEVGMDGTQMFVVMEYVPGADLRTWLEAPRPPDAIADVVIQAGRGLAAAHGRSVIHRDFKPENVLIGADGRARVADFGLSRLAATGALTRIAGRGGTPRYMAPELLRDAPASTASDVFAYCTVIAEVLPATWLAAHRAQPVIAAGRSDDPAARPSIGAIVDALAAPPAHRRRGLTAAAAGAAALAIGLTAFAVRTRTASCPDPSARLAGWDSAQLRAALARGTPVPTREAIDRIARLFDDDAAQIVAFDREVCAAEQGGELAAAQAANRRACLDRRAFELVAVAHRIADDAAWPATAAEDRAQSIALPATCAELDLPAVAARTVQRALYDRFVALERGSDAERIAALDAIERDAVALHDDELAARVALALGVRLRMSDELVRGDQVLERAFQRASGNRDTNIEALALTERSTIAVMRGDHRAGASLVKLALQLADNPQTPLHTRAQVYAQLGRAELNAGNYGDAVDKLRQGLTLIAQTGKPLLQTRIRIETDLVIALSRLGRSADAIPLAEQSAELNRTAVGEHSASYGVALGALGYAHSIASRFDESIAMRTRAIEILKENYPPDHSQVVTMRGELGADLLSKGDYARAAQEYAAIMALTEGNQTLRRLHAFYVGALGDAVFSTGDTARGLELNERALDELTSQLGVDHPRTLFRRFALADDRLELGKLDEAERDFGVLFDGFKNHPLPADSRPAILRGALVAELAIYRGHPEEAERLSRGALAELDELHAPADSRRRTILALVTALGAQRRFADAAQVLATLPPPPPQPDQAAIEELARVEVEAGLGRRGSARARVERVIATLASYPGQLRARARAAALRARLAR
ncbi:MAG TPA: serine/threonine-protein kinase [Kofleriaceae bacterium]|nr:serine/threonine-protein kinase [Kofleriaceae bacterium]